MSFKQIHNEGVVARIVGKGLRDNPYYESDNLPKSESAAAYRAWQMRAEAWELGWAEQEELLNPPRPPLREFPLRQAPAKRPQSIVLQPHLLREAVAPSSTSQSTNVHAGFFQYNDSTHDMAAEC